MLKVAALAVCILGVLFIGPFAVAEFMRMRTRGRQPRGASTPESQKRPLTAA